MSHTQPKVQLLVFVWEWKLTRPCQHFALMHIPSAPQFNSLGRCQTVRTPFHRSQRLFQYSIVEAVVGNITHLLKML